MLNPSNEPSFVIFSLAHLAAVLSGFILIFIVFLTRKKQDDTYKYRKFEKIFAFSLIILEIIYQSWMWQTDRWDARYSLPLELCSISLILTIVLLWTNNKHIFEFVFYAGIGGALQAIITPDLELGFPHFRFFHFFYTHFGIILTAVYFVWYKGYCPTFKGIFKTLFVLNLLLPIIFTVNKIFDGNYMFLTSKPVGGSLLDYLGPYPWYLLSLEFAAFFIFLILWVFWDKGKADLLKSQTDDSN